MRAVANRRRLWLVCLLWVGHKRNKQKGRRCGGLSNVWLSGIAQLLRAAIFLASPYIANTGATFAVAGIWLVFFSGISRRCDEHGYRQGSE